MRTLTFDQYEFEPPDAEEGLEISIAAKRACPFPDVAAFAASMLGVEVAQQLPPPVAFDNRLGPGNVRAYLHRYAGVALPEPCDWPTHVLSDDWNDWDAVLVGPSAFIRYHWWTTA